MASVHVSISSDLVATDCPVPWHLFSLSTTSRPASLGVPSDVHPRLTPTVHFEKHLSQLLTVRRGSVTTGRLTPLGAALELQSCGCGPWWFYECACTVKCSERWCHGDKHSQTFPAELMCSTAKAARHNALQEMHEKADLLIC